MGGFTSKLGDFFSTLFGDSEREHDKERTVDFCTVKSHCCAPCLTTHGELSLSCVMGRGTAKKSYSWRRWQTSCNGFCHAPPKKRTAKICPLPCATIKTHDKESVFAVRHTNKRTTNTLFRPAVLVPLSCASPTNARQRHYSRRLFLVTLSCAFLKRTTK